MLVAGPASSASPPELAGGLAEHSSGDWSAADDELEAKWLEFRSMLVQKGALGSFHDEDGTLVVVVPASG